MVKKVQLPVVGGVRKVISTGSTTAAGTTISEFGSNTITLAQLAAALGTLVAPASGLIGDASTATIAVGPGLSGGGPVLGVVPINLTAPTPPQFFFEENEGPQGDQGLQGFTGAQGPIGIRGFTGEDGTPGEDGWIQGPPGPQGPQGPAGSSSASSGVQLFYDDSAPEDSWWPHALPTVYPGGPLTVNGVLTANGPSSTAAIVINSGTASSIAAADELINRAGSVANAIGQGPCIQFQDTTNVTATMWQHSGGQSELWQNNSSTWNQVLKVLTSRAIVINAPASGDTLEAIPRAGGNAFSASLGTATAYNGCTFANLNGTFTADILANGNFELGTVSGSQLSFYTTNATRITISSTGNVVVNAPTSGISINANAFLGQPGLQSSTNDSTFSATGRSSIILANASATGQTPLDFTIGGSLSGRIRNDFAGNMNYVTTGTGVHDFFTGGDSGVGALSFSIGGGAAIQARGPVAAALVDMTPDSSTFTGTMTGQTGTTTGTINWYRIGKLVTMYCSAGIIGTSNSVSAPTMTGLPAAVQPASGARICLCEFNDNGSAAAVFASVTAGTITFTKQAGAAWTASGNKGPVAGWAITYSL